jgi:glycosyltransferase involved in cell wall biosynthesis
MTTPSARLITVIMPCHNAAGTVARSLRSALDQTHRAIELVVIDDGSRDETADVVRSVADPRVRLESQANQGVSAARNRGLALARGEYVAFLDADDTWAPETLEHLLQALEAAPDAALAYCGWQNLGVAGGRGAPFVPPDYEGAGKLEALLEDCRWPIHAALTRRATIEEVGGFDPRYPTSEDFLLWLRIGSRHRIVRVPEVLAYYHHHGGERATADLARLARNHWRIQRAFLVEHPEINARLGPRRVRQLTEGTLLKKGYACYWDRRLEAARAIFRTVMRTGYGNARDWKYMLPSLLPLSLHRALLHLGNQEKREAQ